MTLRMTRAEAEALLRAITPDPELESIRLKLSWQFLQANQHRERILRIGKRRMGVE